MDVRTIVDLMRRNVWKEGGVLEGQCLSFCPTRNLTQATSGRLAGQSRNTSTLLHHLDGSVLCQLTSSIKHTRTLCERL